MKIGYARVSTQEQHLDLQLDALHQAGCETLYQEQVSGAKTARPELDKALEGPAGAFGQKVTVLN